MCKGTENTTELDNELLHPSRNRSRWVGVPSKLGGSVGGGASVLITAAIINQPKTPYKNDNDVKDDDDAMTKAIPWR